MIFKLDKISDMFIDVAKYVLTAIIISSFMNDVSDNIYWVALGIIASALGLSVLCAFLYERFKKKGKEE
ncbi:hypothetical protein AGMMS49982_08720 [Bacteroidia bacterium]|nr:hypothetical protein AGMMS49982_08720 [Bacteroidia bacterium]